VKREAAIAGLASEGLSLISGSAGAGSSAVVGLNFFAFHPLHEPFFISGYFPAGECRMSAKLLAQ